MNVSRREVTDRVFAVFNSIVLPTALSGTEGEVGWKLSSKDADIWTNIEAYDQPYLGLVAHEDQADQPQALGLTKWTLRYYGLIYFRRDAISLQAGSYFQDIIDDTLDAIDLAFAAPRKGEANTLDGIVADCSIQGTIYVDSGTLDQQCAIIVPITVITGI